MERNHMERNHMERNHMERNHEDGFFGFLKPYKKYLYGTAVALGFVGVIFALVIGLVLTSVVDKAEKAAIPQMDNLANSFGAIEGSMTAVENEGGTLNETIGGLKDPVNSIKNIVNSISPVISILGINESEIQKFEKSMENIEK